VSFTDHEVGFHVSKACALGDNLGALLYRHAPRENTPGIMIIAPSAPSPAMLEVCVKFFGYRILLVLASPDPLINRLMADPIDSPDSPASAEKLRAEFFLFQPSDRILL